MRQGSDWGLGTENFGQFIIFELPICDILNVLNFERLAHEGNNTLNEAILGSLGGNGTRLM